MAEDSSLKASERAIEILSEVGGDDATEALMKSISDKRPDIRMAAIEGLASLGEIKALPQILNCLKDRHSGVRQSAVTAVAVLGDEDNLDAVKALITDRDAGVVAATETLDVAVDISTPVAVVVACPAVVPDPRVSAADSAPKGASE